MADAKCPGCGKPASGPHAPFCSRRCREVDLGRWLTGRFVIPASADEAESEAAKPPAGPAGEAGDDGE